MPLKDLLRDVVENVNGGYGAVIMDYDGIAVDEYLRNDAPEMQTLAVEYVSVLREIKNIVEVLKSGALEEVSVFTDSARFIVRTVSEDVFVLLAIGGEGNYGKARYLLSKTVPALRELLA